MIAEQETGHDGPVVFVAPDRTSRHRLTIAIAIVIIALFCGCGLLREYVFGSGNLPTTRGIKPSEPVSIHLPPATTHLTVAEVPRAVPPAAATATKTDIQSKILLKVVKADSEETAAEDGKAANAVDGNPFTYWHTKWTENNRYLYGASPQCPHEIIIQLIPPSRITGITYLPRQGGIEHGDIREYEVYVSGDGVNFGEPVKSGVFKRGKDLNVVSFPVMQCAYFKLKAVSEINGNPWTAAAEIGIVREGEIPGRKEKGEVTPEF